MEIKILCGENTTLDIILKKIYSITETYKIKTNEVKVKVYGEGEYTPPEIVLILEEKGAEGT